MPLSSRRADRRLHFGIASIYKISNIGDDWEGGDGARLGTPVVERVEIQPIGRGTTQDLKGFRGRPWSVMLGS